MTIHDFATSFASADDIPEHFLQHLCTLVSGATGFRKATGEEDAQGTDYWILRGDTLPPISVDFKWRRREQPVPADVCIETCSIYQGPPGPPFSDSEEHRKEIGWTLDVNKRTDLVVYSWPRLEAGAETGRDYWVVYFPLLCRTAQRHWREWREQFGEKRARNRGYLTLNVFPTIEVVRGAINASLHGFVEHGGRGLEHPIAGDGAQASAAQRKARADGASAVSDAGHPVGDDSLAAELKQRGLTIVDKRPSGGRLWVVGGQELDAVLREVASQSGKQFQFAPRGARSTGRRPGWFAT